MKSGTHFFLLLVWLAISLSFCQEPPKEDPVIREKPMPSLWTDKTANYLPPTKEWTNRVELADINQDGLIDLLFANGGNYSEPGPPEYSRIFINQGAEAPFKEISRQVFGKEKYHARVIKVSDIDEDGIPDIIVGTTFQSQPQLYRGLGKGAFDNQTSMRFPRAKSSVGDIELGDVDADGDLDMVLADWGPGSNMENAGGVTMLWLNDGAGHFTDVTARQMPDIPIQFSWDLEFIDFDNDFDLDIAVSCKRCGTSRLFENDGRGSFNNRRALPAYTNNYEFEAMDVNGDGFLDLVTVNDGAIVAGKSWSRREHLFLNDAGEKFIDATEEYWPNPENIGEDDNNIVFLDYDSDGDPDFLLSSLTGEDRLLINDGTGKFTLAQPVLQGPATPHTLSMVLGDLNNDHKMDLVMGQGEGEEGIEERIFLGDQIGPDTAAPIIANYQVQGQSGEMSLVRARIHDNKSPSMPQDWKAVELIPGEGESLPMQWYGEYLWTATYATAASNQAPKICATDYSGNKSCVVLSH